ncbi:hypothetical protein AAZV13_08G136250 [Glycine max]|nr:hypothetical protein JHK86_021408 [Glycine max]
MILLGCSFCSQKAFLQFGESLHASRLGSPGKSSSNLLPPHGNFLRKRFQSIQQCNILSRTPTIINCFPLTFTLILLHNPLIQRLPLLQKLRIRFRIIHSLLPQFLRFFYHTLHPVPPPERRRYRLPPPRLPDRTPFSRKHLKGNRQET